MTELAGIKRERIARRQVDKFAERRDQLAAAALRTLAEQGVREYQPARYRA
jgi:AcrR family transcriptional regulator